MCSVWISKSSNVTVGLDGNTLNSFTMQPDIGRFVAYILTRPKLEWLIFRMEAERGGGLVGPLDQLSIS